jgi:pimeloyl-ACP methyl ester carboxylesterase
MVLIGATHYFPEESRAFNLEVSRRSTPPEWIQPCSVRGDAQARELAKQFGDFKDSYEDMNFTAPYLGTITARTLIVHSDRDPLFPLNIPVEMHRAIRGSALWIVPHGEHIPIFGAHAREFLDIAVPFLRGEPAPR